MIDTILLDRMQDSLLRLKNPVRLLLFTSDAGCETCPEAQSLVRAVKAKSPKIALEMYDRVMDRDKADQYRVKRVPAIVVQGASGRHVRFYGLIEDVFQKLLVETIVAVSGERIWFPERVRSTLRHLQEEVGIQIFVETDCSQCIPVAETGIGLAFESDLIATDVIIASSYPDLIRKYSIKTLPKTVFGSNLHMDGHVTESEFLEMIFQAEGLQSGPDRRCLVCGSPSQDMVCTSCKARIQGEAVEHKRRGEKLMS